MVSDSLLNTLHDIEHHCNNFFNPQNRPDSPIRNYPEAFLELAERIQRFTNRQKTAEDKPTAASISEGGRSVHFALDEKQNLSWQKAFSAELGIYKRAKFL